MTRRSPLTRCGDSARASRGNSLPRSSRHGLWSRAPPPLTETWHALYRAPAEARRSTPRRGSAALPPAVGSVCGFLSYVSVGCGSRCHATAQEDSAGRGRWGAHWPPAFGGWLSGSRPSVRPPARVVVAPGCQFLLWRGDLGAGRCHRHVSALWAWGPCLPGGKHGACTLSLGSVRGSAPALFTRDGVVGRAPCGHSSERPTPALQTFRAILASAGD